MIKNAPSAVGPREWTPAEHPLLIEDRSDTDSNRSWFTLEFAFHLIVYWICTLSQKKRYTSDTCGARIRCAPSFEWVRYSVRRCSLSVVMVHGLQAKIHTNLAFYQRRLISHGQLQRFSCLLLFNDYAFKLLYCIDIRRTDVCEGISPNFLPSGFIPTSMHFR